MPLELYPAKRAYLADLKAEALGYLEWVPWIAAHFLNNRPRQTLEWKAPAQKLAEVLQ